MKTFTLPQTDLVASDIALGFMRIEDLSDRQIRELYSAAREAGINFLDHAATYGTEMHSCESRFANAVKLSPAERENLIIQSKCGITKNPRTFNFSYDSIVATALGSLQALKLDYLDILLLHRPDALVRPEEVARALDYLHNTGKVRYFGVSNHQPGQIELLRKYVRQPLILNQLKLSLTHANIITQGLLINEDSEHQSIDRDNGVLDYCRITDMTLQAWGPYQARVINPDTGNLIDGVYLGNPAFAQLNQVIDRLATKYSVPAEAIGSAWILRHPAHWQVVLGTTKPERVLAGAAGSDVDLTHNEWYELTVAAGHRV